MPSKDAPKKQNSSKLASNRAKEIGFKDLNEMVKYSHTSRYTLNNWFNKKRPKFEAMAKGAMIEKMGDSGNGKNEA